MRKSSTAIYAIFILYFAAACAAPEFTARAASPPFYAAAAFFLSILRLYLTSRAFAAVFGICVLLTLASAALRLVKRKSCALLPAETIVKTTVFLMCAALGLALIIVAPFLDKTFYIASAAILFLARMAEPKLRRGAGAAPAFSRASAAARQAGFMFFVFAVSAVCGAVSGRMNLAGVAALAAALSLYDNFSRAPRTASRARRSFFVLSIVCALGAHGYVNSPPDAWCESWKPGKDLRLVSPATDAFDVITADGYLFASFKSGSVIRVSSGGETRRLTIDAPAQRMAWNSRLKLLYITAYKSSSPVVIVDPQSFKVVATAAVPDCAATTVALNGVEDAFYFNCESDYKIVMADAATGEIIKTRQFPRGSNIYSIAAAGSRVYAISASMDPWLYTLDAGTLSTISKQYIGYGNQGMAAGLGRDKLFIARVGASKITSYNTLREIIEGSYPAGMIVRDAQQISGCTLLTADYAAGAAREINICGGRNPSRVWRLSPRTRGIWSGPDGKQYAACACGVYELLK